MSESVWFEQVDTALIDFIQSILVVQDNMGSNVVVPVSVRKPDEDFKEEQYPCVTLYNLYDKFAQNRYSESDVFKAKNIGTNKIVLEKSAIPYDLTYQIDFWSINQSDMNEMTRLWLSRVNKYFNLPVLDMSGNERSCFVLLKEDLRKIDILNGQNRIFHSVLTYVIQVELDENVVVEKDMVVNIQVDTK